MNYKYQNSAYIKKERARRLRLFILLAVTVVLIIGTITFLLTLPESKIKYCEGNNELFPCER